MSCDPGRLHLRRHSEISSATVMDEGRVTSAMRFCSDAMSFIVMRSSLTAFLPMGGKGRFGSESTSFTDQLKSFRGPSAGRFAYRHLVYSFSCRRLSLSAVGRQA